MLALDTRKKKNQQSQEYKLTSVKASEEDAND